MALQALPPDTAGTNITARNQPVLAVHRPMSTDEVVRLVRLVHQARQDKTPLYPISGGDNWGYGADSAAAAGCALGHLSGMHQILNADKISLANPVALVEPGVTQGQWYDCVQARCPELTFNVTGSARATRLIGNGLDRGVGYVGPRKEELLGLEVVCGSGQLLKTGFRRLGGDSPLAHSHPFGLGPMLDGSCKERAGGVWPAEPGSTPSQTARGALQSSPAQRPQ